MCGISGASTSSRSREVSSWRRHSRWRRPSSVENCKAVSTSGRPCATAGNPQILVWQKTRDAGGGGIPLRITAEHALQEILAGRKSGMQRTEAKSQIMRSIDRLLSDDKRCEAYEIALSTALSEGAQRIAVLGVGSLLPALLVARQGAQTCVVEENEELRAMARVAATDNGLKLVVLSNFTALRSAWPDGPDVLSSC